MAGARRTRADARFHDLVGCLNAIVWEADADVYRMTFVSPRAIDLTGYPAERWLTDPGFWESNLHPDDRASAIAATDAAIARKGDVALEYRFRIADGSFRWFSDVIRVLPTSDGRGHRVVGVMIDITERKALEAELTRRASHDALTGLFNRERLQAELVRLVGGRDLAVLFLDLDDFKVINDGLGHAAGDEVLRVAGARLRAATRQDDIVARLGGDEFVVVTTMTAISDARALAERLLGRLRAPIALATGAAMIGASIGIAIAAKGANVETVLGDADLAMYEAKRSEARIRVFEPAMRRRILRKAVDRTSAVGEAPLIAVPSRAPRRPARGASTVVDEEHRADAP